MRSNDCFSCSNPSNDHNYHNRQVANTLNTRLCSLGHIVATRFVTKCLLLDKFRYYLPLSLRFLPTEHYSGLRDLSLHCKCPMCFVIVICYPFFFSVGGLFRKPSQKVFRKTAEVIDVDCESNLFGIVNMIICYQTIWVMFSRAHRSQYFPSFFNVFIQYRCIPQEDSTLPLLLKNILGVATGKLVFLLDKLVPKHFLLIEHNPAV